MAVYEMLWDCAYCGTRKLLGKTHRFCPGCGAPQDPSRRYFPPDEDKVAVEGHEYVGADRVCEACGSAMSARARHCTQCGSAMAEAPEARRVEEGGGKPATGPPPRHALVGRGGDAAPRGRGRGCLWAGLGLAAAGVALVAALVWSRPVAATVTGHAWSRSVTIERFAPVGESGWCDAVPAGAYDVSRERRRRETRRVEAGQDCTTVRVDQGDGTFREEERCTPRHREEGVDDDYCRYTVDRWSASRDARLEGEGHSSGPRWPEARLAKAGECRGCERVGGRHERYTVRLAPGGGSTVECEVDEARWREMSPGTRWRIRRRVVTGGLSCGDLAAVP